MWTSINKKFLVFLSVIFSIGIITGVIYILFLNGDNKVILNNSFTNFFQELSTVKINYLATHLLVLPLLLISSILIIGIPLVLFYLFYNGFLIGFLITNFTLVMHFKGFIFGLIYVLITKLVYLFLLIIFTTSIIRIGIYVIKYLFLKEKIYKEKIFILFKKALLVFLIILINDTIIYFLGNNLINIFNFLVI